MYIYMNNRRFSPHDGSIDLRILSECFCPSHLVKDEVSAYSVLYLAIVKLGRLQIPFHDRTGCLCDTVGGGHRWAIVPVQE